MKERPALPARGDGWIRVCLAAACLLLLSFFIAVYCTDTRNRIDALDEGYTALSSGWTLTDGQGNARAVTLPCEVEYGQNGLYTLSCVLPEAAAPATLCVYSNYVSFAVSGPCEKYVYPTETPTYSPGTGNTWHFIRLTDDFAGRTLTIRLRGQLEDDIPYLLRPPLLGSKAAILQAFTVRSLPSMLMAFFMTLLSVTILVLYIWLRKRLLLDTTPLYTALFALVFALYTYCESSYAMVMSANSYLLYSCTLLLLALLPAPLMCLCLPAVGSRLRPAVYAALCVCFINFFTQAGLHISGLGNLRVLLVYTHITILAGIGVTMACLLVTSKGKRPQARSLLLSALPMVAGGCADIALLWLHAPSFNNSFWFSLGVMVFIFTQFAGIIRVYLRLYRSGIESDMLRDMAYRDALTGLGNRNAYERALEESAAGDLSDLCCLVADINDLKGINDRFGHARGDLAIRQTGRALTRRLPAAAQCFRTGGDEFIALLRGADEQALRALIGNITRDVRAAGREQALDISLAVGAGRYRPEDGSVEGFVQRVDSLMYREKTNAPSSRSGRARQ